MLFLAFLNEQALCLIDHRKDSAFGYLRDVQKPGDRNIDVKGFMLAVFENEVIAAANGACDATEAGMENDKENVDPSCQLVCPISYILMTDDHVLAADVRAAIDAWFESNSWGSIPLRKNSPMAHEKMTQLTFFPSKAIPVTARNAAGASSRASFGNHLHNRYFTEKGSCWLPAFFF
jgi:hypothetical protein